MTRYIRLALLFWKQSIIREMEFPKNFWFVVFTNGAHFATQLLFVEILFSHTSALAGWSKPSALVFLATWGIVTSILLLLCENSFVDFGDDVHSGQFDFHLLRPIDAQFIISIRRLTLSHIGEPFFYLCVLGVLVFKGMITLSLLGVAGYVLLLILAMIVGYHIWIAFTTAIFWTPYIDHFNFLFMTVASIARYPLEVYGVAARLVFLTVMPIGLMAALPAEFLLGVGSWQGIVYAIVMTLIITVLTRIWWRFALRHYASASS
ncbi:ABC-2 family transporter protein [Candidatus Uhrbacteria bacterium]|nr:ABC-2 family transporter protein [Candidatus Uhrbacteria bacterium]